VTLCPACQGKGHVEPPRLALVRARMTTPKPPAPCVACGGTGRIEDVLIR